AEAMDVQTACGQLIVGGFAGTTLPESFARALAEGRVGGAILFKRNVTSDLDQIAALTSAVPERVPASLPVPIVAVDQEGGRVARIRPPTPALELPPMRVLASRFDAAFVETVARAQALELRALGFTVNFAPVLDVDTNPANPVIGDRSFAADAAA